MKRCILVLISVFLLFTGCISPRKYAGFVKAAYKDIDTLSVLPPADISINSRALVKFDSLVLVKKGDNYFIPALFYWGVKETFHCEMNAQIPINFFSQTCKKYADSLGFRQKLNGLRLEITINSLPTQFVYTAKEDVIYVLVYAITIGSEVIQPVNNDLSITYKLYSGTNLNRVGTVLVRNNDQPMSNLMRSTRRMTKNYIAQYEQNVRKLSRQCMLKLAGEL